MVTEYGMSDRLGLVTYDRERRPMFLPDNLSQNKVYSEDKAAEIDEEVARVMDEGHKRVQQILSERKEILTDLAHRLLEREIIQGEELRDMLAKANFPVAPKQESEIGKAAIVTNPPPGGPGFPGSSAGSAGTQG